ncbi:hypothetical protein V6N11_017820 [Hibiscus sabdariffa]|uniref:Uncharacterized protein n=1 Tax=Hibiscus sabdariffa TaxID=183260 RepID=A0ABR2T5X9_9ROSI
MLFLVANGRKIAEHETCPRACLIDFGRSYFTLAFMVDSTKITVGFNENHDRHSATPTPTPKKEIETIFKVQAMSQEQEQPAPASQSDQLSPAFDPRRKSETDSEFNRYEGEDMVELDDDDHGSVDPSIRLTVASSTEMDLVRDSIRDQIVEHMKLN